MEKLRERLQTLRTYFLIVLATVVVLGAAVFSLSHRQGGKVRITSDLIQERLEYVQDLVGTEYYYKNMAAIEKEKFKKFGVSIPFTGSRAIFSYEGVIKYGIDVSQVDVNVSGHTVTLTIPDAKIVSHEIPEKSIEIFDSGKNIFNPVTIGDYVDFQSDQKAVMEEQAEAKGFPEMAERKSGEALSAILKAMPGMEQYTITFKYA